MRYAVLSALLLAACATAPADAQQTPGCPPAGYDRAALDALKASEWAIADDAARNAFARALTACLASPDPTLRDGLAFEGLQHMMRARQLSNETLLALADDLQAKLSAPDPQGFQRPFAALVLSEVARTDRLQPFMTPERRASFLDASVTYLQNVRDYRGFDPREGFRHGVAHGADLMLQLTLNPAFGRPELTRIRDAIGSQIAPTIYFYINGEGERLAAPILYMTQRNVFSEAEWTAWLAEVTGPGSLGTWDNWFLSQPGQARRHNVSAFAAVLFINTSLSTNPAFAVLKPGTEAAIRAIP